MKGDTNMFPRWFNCDLHTSIRKALQKSASYNTNKLQVQKTIQPITGERPICSAMQR